MKENKRSIRWKPVMIVTAAVALLIGVGIGAVALLNSGFRFSAAEGGTEPSEIMQEPSSFETLPTTPIEPNTEPTVDTQPVETVPAETKASKEYEKFKVKQDKNYISDFDKLTLETKKIDNKK